MANATSQFLSSATPTGSGFGIQAPSEADVLSVAADPDVKDVPTLAVRLQSAPALVEPVVRKLISDGFLTGGPNELTLSESGERALRYAKVAKF